MKPRSSWLRQHIAAARALFLLTIVTGIGYPLAVTAVGQAVFSHQANGSLVYRGGQVVGSSLLCQEFSDPHGHPLAQWFQPRPSAAGTGCDPTASSATNLGPDSTVLVNVIRERRAAVASFNGVPPDAVPADALTASGSGLDPDISAAYAYLQVARVARAWGLDPTALRQLVTRSVQGRPLGFLGEPTVNVLGLNLAVVQLSVSAQGH